MKLYSNEKLFKYLKGYDKSVVNYVFIERDRLLIRINVDDKVLYNRISRQIRELVL